MGKRLFRGFIGVDWSLKSISKAASRLEYYFEGKSEQALFRILHQYVLAHDSYPTFDYLDGYFDLEKGNDAAAVYEEVKSEEPYANEGEFGAVLDLELVRKVGSKAVQRLKDGANRLTLSSLSDVQKNVEAVSMEVGQCLKDLKSKDDKALTVWGPEGIAYCERRYEQAKKSGGQYLARYGFDFIDNALGGMQADDFITVAAFTSHGKSAFVRRMAHKLLMQGKNVYFETLEMKHDTVLDHFLCIHANDLGVWGSARPRIHFEALRRGQLTAAEESFLRDEVIPDFNNNSNYGSLKLAQPCTSNWTFDDAKVAIKECKRNEMPVEVYVCDYLTLFVPTVTRGRLDSSDYNRMIEDARQFTLDEQLVMVTPHQCNRKSFDNMVKDKNHYYNMDCLSDYHAMDRSSTVVVSLAQPDDLRQAGLIQVQCLKNREGALFPTTRLTVDYSVGQYYEAGIAALSDEAAIMGLLEMGI